MIRKVLLAAFAFCSLAGQARAYNARLHTFHCLFGCPVGAAANDDVIVREIYTLASNPLTKMADWVAYRITPETIAKSKDRIWKADPWLSPEETLAPGDYDGASTALSIDRGHQAPLAAFSGTPFWLDTDILSNITPQSKALNEGSWQRLEARETALAIAENTGVYVLTGPLFERLMKGLPAATARHRVPSGYWKVVATAEGRMSAFLFDQQTPRGANYCDMRVPLEEVQLRARLSLFPGPSTPVWRSLDEALGCRTPPPARPEPEQIGKER